MASYAQYKIPVGQTPWFTDYYNFVDACEDTRTTLDAFSNATTINITSLFNKTASHDTTLAGLQTQITSNDTDIAALFSSLVTGEANITALQTAVSSNDTDIAALQTTTTNHTNWINDVTAATITNNLVTWIAAGETVMTAYANDANTVKTGFTVTELIAGFRSQSLGTKTFATESEVILWLLKSMVYVQDLLKSLGVSYIDAAGNLVPATTPNP